MKTRTKRLTTVKIILKIRPTLAGVFGKPAAFDCFKAIALMIQPTIEKTNAKIKPMMPRVLPG